MTLPSGSPHTKPSPTPRTAQPDPVLILGAGLMGRLLAASLLEDGHRLHLVEAATATALRKSVRPFCHGHARSFG